MKKLSPTFFIYFFILMMGLAFVFPLVHSAYEGFQEGSKNPVKQAKQQVKQAIQRTVPQVQKHVGAPKGRTFRSK